MTGFLDVNGFSFQIRDCKIDYLRTGELKQSYTGRTQKSRQGISRIFSGTTIPLSVTDGKMFQALLEGEGEVWSFNDVTTGGEFGSRGTGSVAGSTWTYKTSVPTPKKGVGCIKVASGNYFQISVPLAAGTNLTNDGYSVVVWKSDDASTWDHYCYTYNNGTAVQYKNGVAGAYHMTTWCTFTNGASGSVKLNGKRDSDGAAADTYYDDLMIIHAPMSTTAISAFVTQSAALGSLPLLSVSGSIISDMANPINCFGAIDGVMYSQNSISSTSWMISFKLWEQTT